MLQGKDNKDLLIQHLQSEVARLSNSRSRMKADRDSLLDELNKIEHEHAEELAAKDKEIERIKNDSAEKDCMIFSQQEIIKEKDAVIANLQTQLKDHADIAEAMKQCSVDARSVIRLMQLRLFRTNSDSMKYLAGDLEITDEKVEEYGFETIFNDIVKQLDSKLQESGCEVPSDKSISDSSSRPDSRRKKKHVRVKDLPKSESLSSAPRNRYTFTAKELESVGVDCSNLPKGSKMIIRKGKADVWEVRILYYKRAELLCRSFKIGRFNVPGSDPMNSKYPDYIIQGNPLSPSFARFYLEMKIGYNMSENRILCMIRNMKAHIAQSSLNNYMQAIMSYLRLNLEEPMLERIRAEIYRQHDETRIKARSKDDNGVISYNNEYIHMAVSMEAKLAVMIYSDGSRSSGVQEEKFFKDSLVKMITCDRAPLYEKIERDFAESGLLRCACWFHGRHYFVDAYSADVRALDIILPMNLLFMIEREASRQGMTPAERKRFRLVHSLPIINKIFRLLRHMAKQENTYGELMKRAIKYMLDDEQAFRNYLIDGRIEMHNNACERLFRHLAMGRRNWLTAGSHESAANLAFMYSLYESCRLNGLDFGDYIEEVLTRMMKGETDFASMIPCNFVSHPEMLLSNIA